MSTTIITRLFHDRGLAENAVKELGLQGFRSGTVHQIAAEVGEARIVEALASLGVSHASATAYAQEAVRTNCTLVVVEAPFGWASRALWRLDLLGGTDVDAPDPYLDTLGKPAFSDMLGIPTLSNNPAPLSDFLGMPVLTPGSGSSTQLIDNPAPLSSALGLPTLKKGFDGKNSSFGLPLLSPGFEGKNSSFGIPLLTRGVEDKETSFGLPLLSNNPAPLSSLLGIPTLIRKREDD